MINGAASHASTGDTAEVILVSYLANDRLNDGPAREPALPAQQH